MADPFVAEIRMFPFNFAPRGWAWCDGQLLPLSQNTALFSLLGTTYGGNGTSNFALPNLQGRSPMHPGQGPGLSLRDLGESGGSETVTLQASEFCHDGCAGRRGAGQRSLGRPGLPNTRRYDFHGRRCAAGCGWIAAQQPAALPDFVLLDCAAGCLPTTHLSRTPCR